MLHLPDAVGACHTLCDVVEGGQALLLSEGRLLSGHCVQEQWQVQQSQQLQHIAGDMAGPPDSHARTVLSRLTL